MSEYVTIEHYVNHLMDEITKRDVEQVSERLRAPGWEEVVRCRDCNSASFDEFGGGWCNENCREIKAWNFCAWAIRRDE